MEVIFEEMAGRIGDVKVRGHYISEIRARLRKLWRGTGAPGRRRGADRSGPYGKGGQRRGQGRGRRQVSGVSSQLLAMNRGGAPQTFHEREILKLLLEQPELLDDVAEELAELEFSSRALDSLRRKIIDIAAGHAGLDSARLHAHLQDEGAGDMLARLTGRAGGPGRQTHKPDLDIGRARETFSALAAILRRTAVLERDLKAAEKAFEENPTEENFARINRIREELQAVPSAGDGQGQ